MRTRSIFLALSLMFALFLSSIQAAEDTQAVLRAAAAKYRAQQLKQFEQAIAELDRLLELRPDDARSYQSRGELHFRSANIDASLADFDRFLRLRPDQEPYNWQRGIALYYAAKYKEGVRQFESHKSVNPQDVENAIWHYLCKARVDGVASAREALIDIDHDRRPWAMDVYRMFQGRLGADEVLRRAEEMPGTVAQRRDNLFYAHLYVGLLYEAADGKDEATRHIEIAVQKYPCSHYMGDVAQVHQEVREKAVE